ncbi:hypothetical protein E4T43_07253 [Aureobasidium subglaciale]|nr:hypothetical protein E4T43_07253 [Aureobasidium subglaciale]
MYPDDSSPLSSVAFKRATDQAPSGYTPGNVSCPSVTAFIRSAAELSPNETAWLSVRRPNTFDAMRQLLGRVLTDFDVESYFDNHINHTEFLPNIGIAVSGGGYRAMLNGAGAIAAYDDRSTSATDSGHLGGLLQASTYFAGLSGGSWLVGTLYANNFTSVETILSENGSVWQLEDSILVGPSPKMLSTTNSTSYYPTLLRQVAGKDDAGFNTTITDYWGRALSYQMINASNGGPGYTFSSIADDPDFTNGSTPLPIIVTDARSPGQLLVNGNSSVYEVNPWELGTFDPTTYAFAPLRFIGTSFSSGQPVGDICVRGFDNAGFIMGTSSSLFNQAFLLINGSTNILTSAVSSTLEKVGVANQDIASYPNPFYHYNNGTNEMAYNPELTLVDGGEDGQNIPIVLLTQPARAVTVIFAIDSSADTVAEGYSGWPNGTSLVATYRRSTSEIANGTTFPEIPDTNTFVNLGLNNQPTFFGCADSTGPLLVYIPNAPYSYNSNVSTFDLSYNNTERNMIIRNGYNVATMGNGTLDESWPSCVGCAILARSWNLTGTAIPDICTQCFQRYCWNGTIDSTSTVYAPAMKLDVSTATSSAWRTSPSLFACIYTLVVLVFATSYIVVRIKAYFSVATGSKALRE